MLTSHDRILGGRARFIAVALALLAGGCQSERLVVDPYPLEYSQRHPIKLSERERSLELHVGSGHGRLTATQRAQVASFAGAWRRESTGFMAIDVPVGTRNELAAREATREIASVLAAMGVPRGVIDVRSYQSQDPSVSGSIRIAYPLIKAVAGPCGLWPDDVGVSPDSHVFENRPYWNLGCATQRNLAASVAYPEDLVQPRAENKPDAARRQIVVDKYRQGQDPSTIYRQQTDSKVSNVGQ